MRGHLGLPGTAVIIVAAVESSSAKAQKKENGFGKRKKGYRKKFLVIDEGTKVKIVIRVIMVKNLKTLFQRYLRHFLHLSIPNKLLMIPNQVEN